MISIKTCFYFFLIVTSSLGLHAQSDVKVDLDALKYFNSYLNSKTILMEIHGELSFDRYSNSLEYTSTNIMYEDPTTEEVIYFKINVDFSIPLANITRIVENIGHKDGITIITYDFYLDTEVKRSIQSKRKGEWLEEKIINSNKVFFAVEKRLEVTDIEKIQRIIRDVFSGIEIETETIKFKD